MGAQTLIGWCDSTVNFWSGCTKVSPGCANCYAETLSKRGLTDLKGNKTIGEWGLNGKRKLHESAFALAHKLNRKPWVCDGCGKSGVSQDFDPRVNQTICVCGSRKIHRRRIFSLSLGDWLDPKIPVVWLARMLDTIRQCPDCDWLLLTKRPELWHERMGNVANAFGLQDSPLHNTPALNWLQAWRRDGFHAEDVPPTNIWLGTSCENQEMADKRIPELLRIPARVRFLSCEPLLGPINLDPWLGDVGGKRVGSVMGINWVIVGGESGPKARPCNVEWIRSIKHQCEAASVACFVKQLGQHCITDNANMQDWPDDIELVGYGEGAASARARFKDKKGADPEEWPDGLLSQEHPEVPR